MPAKFLDENCVHAITRHEVSVPVDLAIVAARDLILLICNTLTLIVSECASMVFNPSLQC